MQGHCSGCRRNRRLNSDNLCKSCASRKPEPKDQSNLQGQMEQPAPSCRGINGPECPECFPIIDALRTFIESGSANGNEAMRAKCLKMLPLFADAQELRDALREISEEIPARPKLPLVSKIADIARCALAASEARSVLAP